MSWKFESSPGHHTSRRPNPMSYALRARGAEPQLLADYRVIATCRLATKERVGAGRFGAIERRVAGIGAVIGKDRSPDEDALALPRGRRRGKVARDDDDDRDESEHADGNQTFHR